MTEPEFLDLVKLNPVNAAILKRLPQLEPFAPQVHLVAGAMFQTVWNVQSGQVPQAGIRDYDLFYWHPDTSYGAEDAVIRRAADLLGDLGVRIEVRNQARVHLWFREKYGLSRPPLGSARDGVLQFLVECTCVGVDAWGNLYAPYGLHDLSYQIAMIRENHPSRASGKKYGLAAMDEYPALSRMFGNQSKSVSAGVLRCNTLNHTPELYAAKADDYRQRWPWLREAE